MSLYAVIAIVIFVAMIPANAIRVLNKYERGTVFRLGRVIKARGPGLIFLIPVIDRIQKVSLRLVAADVPSQDAITKDNVTVRVNAATYFRLVDPVKAIISLENFIEKRQRKIIQRPYSPYPSTF